MNTTVADRIERRLKKLGISAEKASVMAHLSRDGIRNIKRHARDKPNFLPRGATLQSLAKVLKTTEVWLLREEGPEEVTPSVNFTIVPIISWEIAAALAHPSMEIPLEGGHIMAVDSLGPGKYFGVVTQDDSMDRIAAVEATVVADRADQKLQSGRMYIVLVGGRALFRRWRSDPDRWEPYSTNPSHESVFVNPGDSQAIGRVLRVVLEL